MKQIVTQSDFDGFLKVLQNEKHDFLWSFFKEYAWHLRKSEPECKKMVDDIIGFAEDRKNNEPCCNR